MLRSTRRLRQGINLGEGCHRDLLDSVECEFRPVDPKWVKHLMGRAIWYYGDADFPVLQAIYPDLENRFPEETGFENRFQQPLLQMNAPMTVVESDFWLRPIQTAACSTGSFPILRTRRSFYPRPLTQASSLSPMLRTISRTAHGSFSAIAWPEILSPSSHAFITRLTMIPA
jgi:hypothetical protein